ncbi:MAG TPA: zinc-binding alcohol dehydrogenase family protein [Granulicella sp.]
MYAAVVRSFDKPPVYDRFDDPLPAEGEQLVHVSAAALHQIVRSLANGTHYGSSGQLPIVAGVDGTGRLADGTRVYFGAVRAPFGTMAELAPASSRMMVPLPDGLDETHAAAMANPAMSSWVALEARAKFVPGESVLVLGANGVSGRLSLQIAKRLGAGHVAAAARNPDVELLKSLGADSVIDLGLPQEQLVAALKNHLAETGADIVLDYLWGQPAERVLEAIAQRGLGHAAPRIRYVQIGSIAGQQIPLHAATLRSSGLELLGSGFGSASLPEILRAIGNFFEAAVQQPFQMEMKVASLRDVESLWNTPGEGRLVFQP